MTDSANVLHRKILPPSALVPGRLEYFDVAKGIAIICVVVFHDLGGYITAGLMRQTHLCRFLIDSAYNFHVQLFMIISGYFSFQKANQWKYQVNRVVSLYWSYLLWATLIIILSMSTNKSANKIYTIHDLQVVFWTPVLHMWFLHALIVCTVGLFFIRRRWHFIAAAGLCCVLGLYGGLLSGYGYWFLFMILGAYLKSVKQLPPLKMRFFLVSLAFAVAGVSLAERYDINIRDFRFIWSNLAACYSIFYLSTQLHSAKTVSVMAACGRASMPIYLAHVIVAATIRVSLKSIHWIPVSVSEVICIVCSIATPWALYQFTKQLKLDKVVGFSGFTLIKPHAAK